MVFPKSTVFEELFSLCQIKNAIFFTRSFILFIYFCRGNLQLTVNSPNRLKWLFTVNCHQPFKRVSAALSQFIII